MPVTAAKGGFGVLEVRGLWAMVRALMAGGTVSVWLFYIAGVDRAIVTDALNDTILSNSRRWDAVFPDGKIYKSRFLYVSP